MLTALINIIIFSSVQSSQELVMIRVADDPRYTIAHSITISNNGSEGTGWIARRDWNGGTQSIKAADCNAIDEAVASFVSLPPIPIAPPAYTVAEGLPLPIGPILLDGFGTTLVFETSTEDGSNARVELDGGVAYRLWSHRTVGALISCWGPLTPDKIISPNIR